MAIDTISRALSGQASTAAKQAKETADSAMEQAIAAVPGAVSDWLEDNVTPTTPVVDASLSIAGAAADAKATGDGIADLKSALFANNKSVSNSLDVVYTYLFNKNKRIASGNVGTVADLTPVDFNGYDSIIVECSANDTFIITGQGGSIYKAYSFIDANNVVLATSGISPLTDAVITAPANTAKLVVNSANNIDYSLVKVSNVYREIKELFGIYNSINNIEVIDDWVYGKYIAVAGYSNISDSIANPGVSTSFGYTLLPCISGDTFIVTANSGSNPYGIVFVDATYNVLSAYKNGTYNDMLVTAPPNSAFILVQCRIERIKPVIKGTPNPYKFYNANLSINLTGAENEIWTWWCYPQVISYRKVRNHIYWGYTTHDGYTGVACYNIDTQSYTKTHLKKGQIDDHNASAVTIAPDGTVICGFADGHSYNQIMHIRRSSDPECIERFMDDQAISCGALVSYCQFLWANQTLLMFYRTNENSVNKWCVRKSVDYGATWSTETAIVTADIKYYCRFMPVTDNTNILRIIMYSNPGENHTEIRQGFYKISTGEIYNSDATTILGSSDILYTNFTTIIPLGAEYNAQRLLDVAITEITRPLILYCPFTGANTGEYKIYDGGQIVNIIPAGTDFFTTAQLGASWIGANKIILSNESGGTDYIRIFAYNGEVAQLETNVYSETRGENNIRNMRPIADVNGKCVLWQRGIYNSADYTDFNTDAKLYLLNI